MRTGPGPGEVRWSREHIRATGTWYLRLRYNHYEAVAMREAAKAHCQLEDFANARSVYATMATRYDGFHRQRAETRLAEIAKAFEDIREGKEEIANQPDPTKRAWLLYDLAFLYRYALGCDKKARDVYRQILAMDVPGIVKRNAEEWLQETRTRYESG